MSKKVIVQVYGNGVDLVHIKVSKEAHEWWDNQSKSDLIKYAMTDDPDDYEDLNVPKEADFMSDDDGVKYEWYDADGIFEQYWQIRASDARIDIEVDGKSIFGDDSPYFDDVVIGDKDDKNNTDVINNYFADAEMNKQFKEAKYIITIQSVEKGNFCYYTFDIDDEFNKSKLMFMTTKDWEGEDMVVDATTYDGKDLDNEGGDSTGKGVDAIVWKYGE